MSNLPKRVQRELDAANAAEAEYQAARTETMAQAVPVGTVTPPTEATTAVAVPETPPVVAAVPQAKPAEDYEHKFRVLQGMYSADVTRVKEQVSSLSQQLAALQQAPAAPAATQPVAEDIEKFGADLIDMVKRYTEGQQVVTNARLAALEGKVIGVTNVQAQTAEQGFFSELRRLVPNVQEINADPKWLAWLGEVDPVYGVPRQNALNRARQQLDVARVAAIFNSFASSLPATPSSTPNPLSELVTPETSGAGQPAAATGKPFLSEKSVLDFYNEVGRGQWAGRETERAAREAEIDTAVAEGRVR